MIKDKNAIANDPIPGQLRESFERQLYTAYPAKGRQKAVRVADALLRTIFMYYAQELAGEKQYE